MSQVVVVIGPGSIGQAIARRVSAGKHVVLADLKPENAEAAAEVMRDAGFTITTTTVDVASRESVHALVETATAIGDVTGLIHAAGVSPSQAPPETILRVDLYGTALVLEEFGKIIAAGGAGVVIASQSGHRLGALTAEQDHALALTPVEELLALPMLQPDVVSDPLNAYQLAKRGNSLRVMAEAVTWGRRGARVNTISPGIIFTPLARDELTGPRGAGYRRMIELSPGRARRHTRRGRHGRRVVDGLRRCVHHRKRLLDGRRRHRLLPLRRPRATLTCTTPATPPRRTNMTAPLTVLVVGATGSIGSLAVAESLAAGHRTRALVRDQAKAHRLLPNDADIAVGDVTRPDTLAAAVDGVDAIVLTLGSDGAARSGAETVDYAGVRNVLAAVGSRRVRIALMTAIGVTDRAGAYNQSTQAHDWKRRSERLVRGSGHPYTIVRPGWFDYNSPDQHHLIFLQGDTRHAGDSSDGVIARHQIAQVLINSLTSAAAATTTFELVAEHGPAQTDLDPLWAQLDKDLPGSLDGVRDAANMPDDQEPQRVLDDLQQLRTPHQ